MIKFRIRYFIYLLIIVPGILFSSVAVAMSSQSTGNMQSHEPQKSIDPKLFFSNNSFSFYEDQLSMRFDITRRRDIRVVTGILFEIESSDNNMRTVLMDWDSHQEYMEFFIMSSGLVSKHILPFRLQGMEPVPIRVEFNIDFGKNLAELKIGDETIFFHDMDFNVNRGYKFSVLPTLSKALGSQPVLEIDNMSIMTAKVPVTKTIWYWLALIIAIDIVIFLRVIILRRRKRKGKKDVTVVISDTYTPRPLPTESAIMLFGGFYAYDSEGDDITKRFSPMLRELFSLIIVYSADKGISSDKLKEILWFDKNAVSARNNLAVYLSKLRAILESVGGFELNNDTGYWKFSAASIFVDYFEYTGIEWSGELTRENIEKLMSVTQAGNLMPDSDYRWLDKYKAEVADSVIDKLWNYAKSVDISKMSEFIIAVADNIFRFDQLNEQALYLKCKAYQASGRHSSAKKTFDLFSDGYMEVYGKKFPFSFMELLEKDFRED